MRSRFRRVVIEWEPAKLELGIAIANRVLCDIGLREAINEAVEWDEEQCDISPGDLCAALILTMFFEKRPPLYRVDSWYEDRSIDVRALFGEGATCNKLSDTTLGRMLDKLSRVNLGNLFMQISGTAMSRYAILFRRLHSDTSSLSFYGDYLQEETAEKVEEEEPGAEDKEHTVRIVQGYSKDHRPECKQIIVGKVVTEQQIPVAMMTLDGNTSDIEWNRRALILLESATWEGLRQGLYIADSKLMVKDLFMQMNNPERRIPFVSRVPANFAEKLERRVIEQAWVKGEWEEIGAISPGKKACHYWTHAQTQEVFGTPVQLVTVRSSAGEQRYEDKLVQWAGELNEQIRIVEEKTFACEADAQAEYTRFLKQIRRNPYPTNATYDCVQTEMRPVGRPNLKAPKPGVLREQWRVRIAVADIPPKKLEQIKAQEACFVLASNELSYTPREILEAYKGQQNVEIDFRYLKDEGVASVIFVKTPARVEALMMLMHVALLVSSLIQYRLRKGRSQWHKALARPSTGRRAIPDNLTTQYLYTKLVGICYRAIPEDPGRYDFICPYARMELINMFLEMLGFSHDDIMAALR